MLPIKLLQLPLRSSLFCGALTRKAAQNIILFENGNKRILGCAQKFLFSSSTQFDKTKLSVKAVKSTELIQEALQKKKQLYQEKKQLYEEKKQKIKENIRDKKTKVEEVLERENIFTIPNFLCISRIAMSPYLSYTIIYGDYKIAMSLLIAAGLTDFADGYIARNWEGQKSNFGSFLDPLADKTLVATLVVSLSYSELMPLWLTAVILFRDLFLIAAAFVIRYNSLPPSHRTLSKYFDATNVSAELAPTFISKVNTAVQLFTIAASLGAPIFDYGDHIVLHSLWYLTGCTTALAALSYYTQRKNTYKYLRKNQK